MSDYLPPGCTDSMCEPYNPRCNCGCRADAHYAEDNETSLYESLPLNAAGDFEYGCVELNADGEVVHACDTALSLCVQCDCLKFEEDCSI